MHMHFHLLAWAGYCHNARDKTEYLSCRMENKVIKISMLLSERNTSQVKTDQQSLLYWMQSALP